MGSMTVLGGGGVAGCESICVWCWDSWLKVKEVGESCFLENKPKSIEDISRYDFKRQRESE
jgi:hypothetical protein